MLGICTIYRRCEANYFAMRLAHAATARGMSVAVGSLSRPTRIDPRWDAQVGFIDNFERWAGRCDRLLWTEPPTLQHVEWAKARGIRTACLYWWHAMAQTPRDAIRAVDCVFAPSREVQRFLQTRNQIANIAVLPWDNGMPISRKRPRDAAGRRLLLPLFDTLPYRTEGTVLSVAERLLGRYRDATLTVLYNSATFVSRGKRQLRRLVDIHGDRVSPLPGLSPLDRAEHYRDYDLTLYTAGTDEWGMPAVDSLTAGTPVAAFAVPPLSELLDTACSLVVDCGRRATAAGVPCAVADYTEMERRLVELLDQPSRLARLQESTSTGLKHRRSLFHDTFRRFAE